MKIIQFLFHLSMESAHSILDFGLGILDLMNSVNLMRTYNLAKSSKILLFCYFGVKTY